MPNDSINRAMERALDRTLKFQGPITPRENKLLGVFLTHIARAMVDAEAKHGPLTKDPVRAGLIMVEEVGEAVAEILTATRLRSPADSKQIELALRKAINELAQVAAMTILMIENVEEYLGDVHKNQ